MFLRSTSRWKDGKAHWYWSLVENRRVRGGRVVQQTVLYLGEINDSQKEQWIRAIEVFDEDHGGLRQLKLFAAERGLTAAAPEGVQVCLRQFELHRPRQWGGCWLFTELWKELGLEEFWRTRLGFSREGTHWEHVLETLCCYRLLDPGSEWRLHRTWFERSAMADLLGEDFSLAAKDTLYRCLDRVLEHQRGLFDHLSAKWKDLFGVNFEVLLYDLTSTYFESDPSTGEHSQRKFGYSRDKRPDCVQVVIALVITPEGFPLAYEVMPGNTSDKTTLRGFLHKIENQYGKAKRIWIMDRGIPTEEVLAEMRAADPPVHFSRPSTSLPIPLRLLAGGNAQGAADANWKPSCWRSRGKRRAKGWKSNCCRALANSMCWRAPKIVWPRSAPCAAANSKNFGRAWASLRGWHRLAIRFCSSWARPKRNHRWRGDWWGLSSLRMAH